MKNCGHIMFDQIRNKIKINKVCNIIKYSVLLIYWGNGLNVADTFSIRATKKQVSWLLYWIQNSYCTVVKYKYELFLNFMVVHIENGESSIISNV